MSGSIDVAGRVQSVARRATWQRRAEWLADGLRLGAACGVAAVAWRALVDPGFAWAPVAAMALAAGLVPFAVYGLSRRVQPLAAAWLLDRRLGAEGRIATLFEAGLAGRFAPCLEREAAALLAAPWRPSWRGVGRRLGGAAGLAGVAVLVLLLASPPVASTVRPLSAAEEALRLQEAAARFAAALAAAGHPVLAERLDRQAAALAAGDADPEEAARVMRALEDRFQVEGWIVSLRRVLGESAAGRELRATLLGEAAGDGVATTGGSADEKASRLEEAAALPGLPEALRRQLARVLAAARGGDDAGFEAAGRAVQELLGPEVPAEVLAGSAEILAALGAGARSAGEAAAGSPGGGPAPRGSGPGAAAERAGSGADPAVRGGIESDPVFDPNLRRVIRRYFDRD
ncbi:MAG: hypothetical protein JXQ29_18020 [Planctomycetes bacterium]|nr:hypothetical protein [Planctomycetota bacterium]